ncbi:MAG: bifunctional RNase H/acid phosphatase [Motilibacteraceae bacterium]
MSRFVVEADGGSRGNPGPAAFGALVRDAASGDVLAEAAEHIGVATNNVAEYRGLIAGLRAVAELDPAADVEVRMDSKLVVEQMSGRWKIKHPDMKPLALEASRVLPGAKITYTWVPRERNKAADALVNQALDAALRGEEWVPREAAPRAEPAVAEPVAQAPTAPALPRPRPDLGPGTTLVLARHGATAHTLRGAFSGSDGEDPPLSEEGLVQAERLATAVLARGEVDAVVSSPLQRCLQTAEEVALRLGLQVRVERDLRECGFGQWEGLTFAEARERDPEGFEAWLASPSVPAPGGESFEQVAARVRVARDKTIARFPGRTVLVVAHVTPIKVLVAEALGAPLPALFRMHLDAGSLSVVSWWADGGASLRAFNDTSHLVPRQLAERPRG